MKRAVKRALAHGAGLEIVRHLMGQGIEGEGTMFEFDPASATSAWVAAQYEATITNTEEGASKKGAPMLTVTYEVYGPQNKRQNIKDFFVKANGASQGNLFKLKQLCAALGDDVAAAFKSGKLDHKKMLRGRNVLLMLEIEESPQFGDRNRIDSYTKLERVSAVAGKTGTDDSDEEVPF